MKKQSGLAPVICLAKKQNKTKWACVFALSYSSNEEKN